MAKIRVKLSEPLVIDGTKHTVLELRDTPTLGDLIAAEKAGLEDLSKDVFLYARLAGLLPEDLHALSVDDYEAVVTAVSDAKKARAAAKNPPAPPKSATP